MVHRGTEALREVLRDHLGRFWEGAEEAGRWIPPRVRGMLERISDCGDPERLGFVRLRCWDCGEDRVVVLPCGARRVCSRCGGRRMVEEAAHLVDNVLPRVSVRQWVLSLPMPLRFRLAWDIDLKKRVMEIFVRERGRSRS